jgi:hypothetical protein
MNELQTLYIVLRQELPDANLRSEAPVTENRANWLDIEYLGKWVTVEWRPEQGFGVSLLETPKEHPLDGLFYGPDHIVTDWADAKGLILSLLEIPEMGARARRVAVRG